MLRREGDRIFKTGLEATQLLTGEALRRDEVCRVCVYSICVYGIGYMRDCVWCGGGAGGDDKIVLKMYRRDLEESSERTVQ